MSDDHDAGGDGIPWVDPEDIDCVYVETRDGSDEVPVEECGRKADTVPADKLRQLVAEWRGFADSETWGDHPKANGMYESFERCADELEQVIEDD